MPVRVVPAHGVGGGMERVTWSVAHGLARRGHDLTVATTAHPAGIPEESDGGVRILYVGGSTWRRYEASWWDASYRLLRDEHTTGPAYDAILSQSAGGLGYLHRARDELGLPSTVLLHGSARAELGRAWRSSWSPRGIYRLARLGGRLPRQLARWRTVAPAVSRWAAVSPEVAADNRRELGIGHATVEVVPPGVDLERFHPDAAVRAAVREALGIPSCAPVLVLVNRLEREKGVEVALEAARRVRVGHHELRVLVAGHGHDERRLRRVAQRLDLADATLFLGLVDHDLVPAVLAAGDVFVHASLHAEGCPVSVLEAAAAGLPVMASDSAGARQVVVDGSTGVLTGRGDAGALAGAVSGLLADGARRAAMGSAACEAARSWSTEAMVDAFERLLGEAVRSPAR